MRADKSRILHFHIPKTAGTALREYFKAQLGADRVSSGINGLRIEEALLRWPQADVISGHFNVYQGDRLPADRINLTCLRDPRDRLVSEFFFQKNENDTRLLDAQIRRMDFAEYLDHLQHNDPGAASVQMYMLGSLGSDFDEQLTVDKKFAAAQRALDQFQIVGLQEDLEDFTCMIAAYMDWPVLPLPRSNITRGRPALGDLQSSERQALEHLLGAEIELYQYARSRFQRDRRGFIRAAVAVPGAGETKSKPAAAAVAAPAPPKNFGDKRCELLSAKVHGDISGPAVMCGERMHVDLRFAVREPLDQVNVGFSIKDEAGALVFGTNSLLLGDAYALERGEYTARFTFTNRLGPGNYQIDCSFIRTKSHHDGCYHWVEKAARFEVYDSMLRNCEGRVQLDPDFSLSRATAAGKQERIEPRPVDLEVRTYGRTQEPLREFVAGLELMTHVASLARNADVLLPLRVRNLGSTLWPASGRNPVALSYRWLADGRVLVADGIRSYLPANLPGGEGVIVPLQVRVPNEARKLRLVISPLQEHIAWFVDRNPRSALTLDVMIN